MEKRKRILTGDRPTGKLHIGHYFGSLQNRVALQDEYETYILTADVQALTDNFDNPGKVRDNILQVAMDNLAVGIDPNKSTMLIQSLIPEIAELTIFYMNLVTMSRLQRVPTVKHEISQKKGLFGENAESVTLGFVGYPVSQAADITVFNADVVPVGEDQVSVLEVTREIVRKFNSIYGEVLVEPEAKLSTFARVKGLDGNEKMGKSLGNAIYLSDSREEITKKVMGALTDTMKIKANDPANPDVCMVSYYHNLFSKDSLENIKSECKKGQRGCVACKRELLENIITYLDPIQEKRKYYEERPNEVIEILMTGTNKAREVAKETMYKVREAMQLMKGN